jgi:steroid delta-isomerase-like uncharacterized protein
MSVKNNKVIIRRFIDEVFTQGKMEVIDELVAEDVSGQDAAIDEARTIEAVRNVVVLFRTAFPDAVYTIHDLIAEGDRVVARWSLTGTHRGTYLNVSPTEKQVTVNGIIIYSLEDEKIVEYWGEIDHLGLMRQLSE